MSDEAQAADLHATAAAIRGEIARRVVGQRDIVEHLLVALFARGHCLFVGVPGLAKTLLIQTLADVLHLSFSRIQFTPDLMPSDITGSDILETDTDGRRALRFVKGPAFCNILLADEVNRTPPKTQAALLQAMQEARITASGRTYPIEAPFHVFATQNPIEQEGTYPLPEAQLDRFMMQLTVDYPSAAEESEIVRATATDAPAPVQRLLDPPTLLAHQALVRRVPAADPIIELAVRITRATRPGDPTAPPEVRDFVAFGAGPRAAQHLVLASKARALLAGRVAVDTADVRALARPVLRHRILANYQAEAQRVTTDALVAHVLAAHPDA